MMTQDGSRCDDSNHTPFAPPNGLTPIPFRIHWPATQVRDGSESLELDQIAIDNFLDTLAQIAIAIATTETSEFQVQERDN